MAEETIMEQRPQGLLASVDPEILHAVSGRAREIARGASIGSKLAAALALGSIPVALGAVARDLYGQAPSDVLDVLQFALLLEQLESELYTRAVAANVLIPASDLTVITTIRRHESEHVSALRDLITGKGATPAAKPAFDFTAHGNLPDFDFGAAQYATFTALAQALEDTGVRAYKGQLGRLVNDKAVLTTALAIHSVEARHASEIRRLRGRKGWITSSNRDELPAFLQGVYDGEDNVVQGGVNLTAIAASVGGVASATEAFDEPLTRQQVTDIVAPFLA
jgi:hypothetical protein